ncbi:MAG: protein kinase [Acidobacteriota bacterium]
MSVILVVEQDAGYAKRIVGVAQAAGLTATVVGSREEALRSASSQPPQLVFASGTVPGAVELLERFSRSQGGPGSVVILPVTLAGVADAGDYSADGILAKPFADDDFQQLIRSFLAPPAVKPPTKAAATPSGQLTSEDIFGDVLAEVEAEAQRAERMRRRAASKAGSSDIDRKLEETLSGVFPTGAGLTRPTPPPPEPETKAPPRRARTGPPSADEIDDLLDKTLSSLELQSLTKKAAPKPAAPQAAPPALQTPAAQPPAAQPPAAQPLAAAPSPPQPAAPQATTPAAAAPLEAPTLTPLEESGAPWSELPVSGKSPEPPAPFEAPTFEPPPALDVPELPAFEPPTAWDSPPAPAAEDGPPVGASTVRIGALDAPGDAGGPRSDAFPPPADSGWSVTNYESDSGGEDDSPSDFTSAFAFDPKDGTGSWIPPTDPAQAQATPDDEAPAGDALDGVLQIRGDAQAGGGGETEGRPFGDYRLLERVAVGGMAEVWRARRRGVEGFQKTVAIKKILSHLTGSADFVTMFIDEAKLAAQLSHANIIQIYDLGKVEDDFFIAMEFVEGRDLRSILTDASEQGKPIPIGLCLTIVAALARALDYAHRKRDFDDHHLGLVHRDVSPQNVLISYEGEIKLCDFGIVKAVAKASTTQMGALKGKLQYMSPEQAWGKDVDARSDIFSLGSVFFEILTGEKLFTGDSEIGVLDAVRDCRIRSPRELEPSVPEEVARIVLRALEKTPEARYQTAGELERDIAAVLEAFKPSPSQGDLADYLKGLFSAPGIPAKAQVQPVGGTEAVKVAAPPQAPAQTPSFPPPGLGDGTGTRAPSSETNPSAVHPPAKEPAGQGKAKKLLVGAILLGVLLALAAIVYQTLSRGDSTSDDGAAGPAPAVTAPATDTAPATSTAPSTGPATEGTDPDADAPGESDGAPTAPQPGAADAPDPGPGAAGEDGEAPNQGIDTEALQQMIDAQLAPQREQLERDFEAEKRRLEEQIRRVQEAAEAEGGDPDEADPEGGGEGDN